MNCASSFSIASFFFVLLRPTVSLRSLRIAVTGEPTVVHVQSADDLSLTFNSLSTPIVTYEGVVSFAGSVASPTGSEAGIWTSTGPSNLVMTAKENSPVLAYVPQVFFGNSSGEATFEPLKLTSGYYPTFRARLIGDAVTETTDTAFYRTLNWGAPTLVFREGDVVSIANMCAGDLFEVPDSVQETAWPRLPIIGGPPGIDTAVRSPLGYIVEGSSIGDLSLVRPIESFGLEAVGLSGGLYRLSGGSAYRIGISLTNAPGVQISRFNNPVILYDDSNRSNGNQIVVGARLTGTSVLPSNDSAILVGTSPPLTLREGNQVPGALPGVVFGDLATDNIVGGGNSTFLFHAPLIGPGIDTTNDWALTAWTNFRDGFTGRVLAQEGQYVSGLPAGSVLTGLDAPHFQFNLANQTVFNADYIGPTGGGKGLFYTDMNRPMPNLIVRTGQQFDIGGGIFRTISGIGLMETSSPWDGRASQINDRGVITFNLSFTDGSQGVFTTRVIDPVTFSSTALWNVDSDGNWSEWGNWQYGAPPNGRGALVGLSNAITAAPYHARHTRDGRRSSILIIQFLHSDRVAHAYVRPRQ